MPILRGAGLASGVDAPVVWPVMRWPSPWAISNASCLSLRFILRPRDMMEFAFAIRGWLRQFEGATCQRAGCVPVDAMSGQEVTSGATRNAVGTPHWHFQVARPAMSILLRLNSAESRHDVRNSHGEDVGAAAGEGRPGKANSAVAASGRLAAEPLQRQEGCEEEGFIPESFGLSFQVAVV